MQHLFCLLYSSGTVTISGGTVNATVDGWAAGIGGGNGGDGGTITISGGTVNATGGDNAAGIGGGSGGAGGTITISGGTVNATYGSFAAGIGGGIGGAGGTITISNAVVFATCGTYAEAIGKGYEGSDEGTSVTKTSGIIFEGSSGQVYDESLTLAGDLTVPAGTTLTIPAGTTLTVPEGKTLTNNGTILRYGTLNGTVTGTGRVFGALTGSGTQESPYQINTTDDWANFGAMVEAGLETDKYYQLSGSWDNSGQPITTMVGTSDHPFSGTFLGNGKTLTVSYSGNSQYMAPFSFVNGAAISGLTVAGTITSTVDGDGTHGGFVGVSSGATVFENCVFAGAITGDKTTNCGGFVGWNSGSITYTNCLQKGTLSLKTTEGSATFNRGTAPAEASSNYYYLTPYGTAQGTQVFTITTTGCTVTSTATVSDGSTDYYAASTEVTLSHADQTGYSFDGYTVTKVGTNPAETVEVNENVFLMPASNVTVTVAWSLSKESITLAHAQQTFSCSQALDFTDVTGLAAYIASGYDDGKVILSRVMKVPAGTGLLIVGTECETYQIPYATVNAVYSNFLKPVLEEQTVPQTEDSWHALDGRKLNTKPVRRGLYLHNGKQEVVR